MIDEKVLLLSMDSLFIREMKLVIPEAKELLPFPFSRLEQNIEAKFGAEIPTLILIDSAIKPEEKDAVNVADEDGGSKAASQYSLSVLKAVDLLRIRQNWKDCLIFFYSETFTAKIINALSAYGADRIMDRNKATLEQLKNNVSFLRARARWREGKKLNVLVAENHVETFQVIRALLADSCNTTLSVDNRQGNIRSCRKLSPARVLEDVRSTDYDAVIVDLALSPEEEKSVESVATPLQTQNPMTAEIYKRLEAQLFGLVTLRLIRKEYERIPMCVLSNYVFQPAFKIAMRDTIGSSIYDSIAVFPKDPEGRRNMREWLCRLSN